MVAEAHALNLVCAVGIVEVSSGGDAPLGRVGIRGALAPGELVVCVVVVPEQSGRQGGLGGTS